MSVLDSLGVQVVKCGDFGGNRPYAKVAPWGAQVLYFNGNPPDGPAGDPFVTPELMLEAEGKGFSGAVYFVMPRDQATSAAGAAFAEGCSARVDELGGMMRVEAVMVDCEKVPLAFQAGFIARWDKRRPLRPTLYSVEPYQDASQNDYAAMLANNTRHPGSRKVTFQCYFGGMQPQVPESVGGYLTARGVPLLSLCPTIDPAQPAAYIGSAFACSMRGVVLFEAGRIP